MFRPNSDTSLTISSQVTLDILNRAREMYLNRIRNEALNKKSIQASKQYPVECTQKMMEMVSFKPIQNPQKIEEEQHQSPPQTYRDPRQIKTTHASPRFNSNSRNTSIFIHQKLTKKASTDSTIAAQGEKKCFPLFSPVEEDSQIQQMRQKKQRVYELEKYFVQSQKQERSKLRHKQTEIINYGNFTTDFNGQRIEMKGVYCRKDPDPYTMIEMPLIIREQREESRINTEQRTVDKKKTFRKQSLLLGIKPEMSNRSKLSKDLGHSEAFTLKEIENFINRDNKRRKNHPLNRSMSKFRMPEVLHLNLTKMV